MVFMRWDQEGHRDVYIEQSALTLSGVVLHDASAPAATPAEALGGVIGLAPTTRREFTSGQRIVALVAYGRPRDQPRPVDFICRVMDHQLREVLAEPLVVPADRFATDNSAETRFDLPLGKLQPGAFVLCVEATRDSSTVRREVPFTVR